MNMKSNVGAAGPLASRYRRPMSLFVTAWALAILISGQLSKAAAETTLSSADQTAYKTFADLLINQRKPRLAYETYTAPNFVQHMGPMAPNLANTLKAWEGPFSAPTAHFDIQSIRFEGDMAILTFHGYFDPARPGGTTVQRDRMVSGRIVEEWGEFHSDAPPPNGGPSGAPPQGAPLAGGPPPS
jgi:hypothetical protein